MKGLIKSKQIDIFNKPEIIGYGDKDFFISIIDRDLANEIIRKNHYSHKVYNATYIHLGLFCQGLLVGVLQYGYAMNPASCDSVVSNTNQDEYLELNRMWLDDLCPKNSESKAISYTIRFIKNRYPKIKWIQSFADERCGKFGIVYQAANFKYYGEHTSVFWELDGVVYHNIQMTVSKDSKRYVGEAKFLQENRHRAKKMILRQFRYLYFLDKKQKNNVLFAEHGYPKHYENNNAN